MMSRFICRNKAAGLVAALFLLVALPVLPFSEVSELRDFQRNLTENQGSLKIGYLVHIPLLQSPENGCRIRQAVGRYFYEGIQGYLAHLDIDRVMRLMVNEIPFRVLDKKRLDDKREHWYFVTTENHEQAEAVKARFESLFNGVKMLLIRIRPSDEKVLAELGVAWSVIEEVLWKPVPGNGAIELPYLSQMNNALNPTGTCQNTCLAMLLRYYGWKGTPDDITRKWGSQVAQTPEGGAKVFNAYAEEFGLAIRALGKRAPYAEFRAALEKGHPLTVHGYFTAGHVLIANSCDGDLYDCHDPAGK